MTRYLSRDRAAIVAGLLAPLTVAAVLLPLRASWSNTDAALVLVVAVVAVAAIGNRAGGALAAVSAAAWFDFFFTRPYGRFTIASSADVRTAILLRTFGNGQYYGRFMLQPKPGSRPSRQARLVAVTLADQAGRAFGTRSAARSGG
jgi:K+-sensing histidine kinase KdpD